MNYKQAQALARKIEKDDPRCNVTGYRKENGSYAIDVVDTRTGYSFVVSSHASWEERKKGE